MSNTSRSAQKLGFYIHAVSFVIGMPLLVLINLLTSGYYWFLWALPAWCLGLFFHWLFSIGPAAARFERTTFYRS